MKYFLYSKNLLTSILFIAPLFFLYELIAFLKFNNSHYTVRNTADSIFRDFISIFTDNIILAQSFITIFFFLLYIYYNQNELKEYYFNISYMIFMCNQKCVIRINNNHIF